MTYQVLARKWRPKSFSELTGQESVVQAIANGLDQGRLHHAFLFTGTRGVGKTTIARILAKCLNCETGVSSRPCGECASCVDVDSGRFVDMIEIDAASRTGVDDTRELLDSVHYTPTRGRYKVYIIDEAHMLSKHSFNALLKTLEEPPPHVKFVLATTDVEKIPVTILSRCLQFNLKRLLPGQIGENLARIVAAEGLQADAEALDLLSRAADGSMRDALSLLDQAISFGGDRLSADSVVQMLGIVDHAHVASLVRALAAGDALTLLAIVEELVARSRNLDSVLGRLAETMHRICLLQCVPGYRDDERSDWKDIAELAGLISPEDAQLFYQIAIKGREEQGLAPDPRTGLEMTLLRMLAFMPRAVTSAGPGRDGPVEVPRGAGGQAQKSGPRSVVGAARASTAAGTQPAPPQPQGDTDWVALARRLKLKGQAGELARHLHLQSRSENQWEFTIARSLRHLGSNACVDHLRRAISEHVGQPVSVRLLDSEAADLHTAASEDEKHLRSRMSEAERAINQDPTVIALKEQMGARILENSVQPLQ